MTYEAPKPEFQHIYITLENSQSGITGLSDIGPLYNDTTELTLVELIRVGRIDWGAFEQEFEEIPLLDKPQPVRNPTRENAQLTVEVIGFVDTTDTLLSMNHLLRAGSGWCMGVTNDAVGAAEYNFLKDTEKTSTLDMLGWAIEVVQYADDDTTVLWRRILHNCFLKSKPLYASGGKVARVELTISDARYIEQLGTDVPATHVK
jgi:hypothetical protein